MAIDPRREFGRRARQAMMLCKQASPNRGTGRGQRSGQERNFWAGYHLAYAEVATGRSPMADNMKGTHGRH
jgi:hypothetical protein